MTKATPLKAIRAKCLDCACGNRAEVRRCELGKCPLHPYRFGKRPNEGKDTTPEHLPGKPPENPGVPVREKVRENG